jgi:hypothetical protein
VPNAADLHVNGTVSDDKPHPQNDADDEIPPWLIREVQRHYEAYSMDFDGCCPLGCGAKDFVGHFRSCILVKHRCKERLRSFLRSLLECPAQLQRPLDPDKLLWACFQGLYGETLDDDSLSAASLVDDVPLPPPPPLPSAPVPPLRRYDSDYFPGSDDEWECERTDDLQILHAVKHMDGALAELTMSLFAAATSEYSGSAAGCKRQHSTNNAPTPASPTSEYSGAAGCKHHFRTSK